MSLQFTPAAERALAEAWHWTSRDEGDELEPPELLLGLLAEAECRAACVLAAHGVDADAVRKRWPKLKVRTLPASGRGRFSTALDAVMAAASDRLRGFPPPLVLATEHLLLGLAACVEHDASRWLAEKGLAADALDAQIHRLYGHRPIPPEAEIEGLDVPRGLSAAAASLAAAAVGLPAGDADRPAGPQSASLLRVIDAAANRAREGLRTVEDYVRFVLDDRHLTGELKQLRHRLAAALSRLPALELQAARDTEADVGTSLTAGLERSRLDLASVATAGFKRLQEALRSLEEFAKVPDSEAAAEIRQCRYRSYSLERAVGITLDGAVRLSRTRFYVLLDGRPTEDDFCRLAESLVAAGVGALQLRDKALSDRQLLERARRLRQLTRGTSTLFIVNDRPDVAALSQADGVHLGQDELTVKDARTIVGPRAFVGVSTHSLEQARRAVLDGANYIGVGPTFVSQTKRFQPGELVGLGLLERVAREIRLPAFAIGGITRENLPQVLAAGFSRAAVGAAVVAAPDPAAAAAELAAMLEPRRAAPDALPAFQSVGGPG